MPTPCPTLTESETTISTLLVDTGRPDGPGGGYRLHRVALQEGIDVFVWQGEQRQPVSMHIHDDWGRVQFCYALHGHSHFALDTGRQGVEFELPAGSGCISYTPDCRGHATHAGPIESVTVSIQPDLLRELAPDIDPALRRKLDSARCCVPCRCSAEMHTTARTLSDALRKRTGTDGQAPGRPSLWLLGQSFALASLMLEAHRDAGASPAPLSRIDHPKLMRARNMLLADLTHAPTIAELARATGLSEQKLKRGFRQLFRHSVYGLFQQERMHEARRRLSITDTPVMTVATDMGYTNASHFTTAFQKQFGVNPSAFKRRR
ncbi:AraC family transcriptional regulator [Burkholderia pyrrocinia]|uniref:AraC family transcriptional regulator n=1 Tax=Burkholderia pyrrocinia TaxID=60550 RepID=A0ABZ3BN51_BURPY